MAADNVRPKVAILVEFNYEDLELWYPLLRFKEEGYDVFTVGPEEGKVYQSKKGYPCKADKCIENVTSKDIDGLVIPGGFAPDYWRRDKRFVDLVKTTFDEGKPVASICHGPWMLCSAKILNGKKVTCFYSIKDDVTNAGGVYEDAAVVVDGNLITSRTPNDLPDFCKAIMKQLNQ